MSVLFGIGGTVSGDKARKQTRGSTSTSSHGVKKLLSRRDVALMFRVDPRTVTRWAEQGKLRSLRTAGGQRRYRLEDVQDFLRQQGV